MRKLLEKRYSILAHRTLALEIGTVSGARDGEPGATEKVR
jgi:hypothetical protein